MKQVQLRRRERLRRRRLTLVGASLLLLFLLWRLGLALFGKPPLAEVQAGSLVARWQGEVVVSRSETVQVSPVGGRLVALVSEGEAVVAGEPVAEVLPGPVVEVETPISPGHFDEARWAELQAELRKVRSQLAAAGQAWNEARGVPEQMALQQQRLDALAQEEQWLAGLLTQLEVAAGRLTAPPAPPPAPTGGEVLYSQRSGYVSFRLDGQESQGWAEAPGSLAAFDAWLSQEAAQPVAAVQAGEAAFKIIDPAEYRVIAALPKEVALTLRPEQAVELRTDTGTFAVTVLPFELQGERNLVAFAGNGLPPEFLGPRHATVELHFGEHSGVLVPNSALVEEGGYLGVRVWQRRQSQFIPVQLLGTDGTTAVVLGPAAGAQVVLP